MSKTARIGLAVLCAVPVLMLLVAIFGKPPYAYFGVMKGVVGVCGLIAAAALPKVDKRLSVLSVFLIALVGVQIFGSFERAVWVKWNVMMGIAFAAGTAAFYLSKDDAYLDDSDAAIEGVMGAGCFGAIAAVIFIWSTLFPTKPKTEVEIAAEKQEQQEYAVRGEWKSIDGTNKMVLDQDKRATYGYKGAELSGSWSTKNGAVHVDVKGSTGSMTMDFKRVENGDFSVLAPEGDAGPEDYFYQLPHPDEGDYERPTRDY